VLLYPAIDLRGGRVVRLQQGDFAREQRYRFDALALAQSYEQAGASWLHVVDLDGAKDALASQANLATIAQIAKDTGLQVQTGGGIRSQDDVRKRFDVGCARVVLGSKATQSPEEVRQWMADSAQGADGFCIALDCKQDAQGRFLVHTHGWQQTLSSDVFSLLSQFSSHGFRHALITDIALDGMLQGSNVALYQRLTEQLSGMAIQASGGVSALADLLALRSTQVAGVVIGKALLENRFTLQEALQC
jgi:phosphoribosylformimino-5-aminoimidazole carboxamide ribotide isomerase